jgi:5-methylcytosine-specific restriction endonuclease McrA
MKQEILELRAQGRSYKEIVAALGCSISTVAYHCGKGQKNKKAKRDHNWREKKSLINRVVRFQDRKLKDKCEDFQRCRSSGKLGKRTIEFNWRDVIEKFGWETKCYLTGRKIDLSKPSTYQFDHIVPYSRGGLCTLDNLAITYKEANAAKGDMLVEDFIELCKEVLAHHGYQVEKAV